MRKLGLKEIRSEIPELQADLRYSGQNNFTGIDLYGCLDAAFAQPYLIRKLKYASNLLRKKKPGYQFIVFDAARPIECQWALWKAIRLPESRKHIYVADPRKGSIHNYGCAIDLSIVDERGIPLDMGTEFDFFGELAQPRCELKMRKNGKLTDAQIANRQLLRTCMKSAGFLGTSSEWWHFNACNLKNAKKQFSMIP
jgi:D-alanyl-D-alanine dipeptidase